MATREQLNRWVRSGLLDAFAEGKELQYLQSWPDGDRWHDHAPHLMPPLDADPDGYRVKPEQTAAPKSKNVSSDETPPPEIVEVFRAIERARECGLIKAGMLGVVFNTPRTKEITSFYSFHYDAKDSLLDLLYVLLTTAIQTQLDQFTCEQKDRFVSACRTEMFGSTLDRIVKQIFASSHS